MSIERYRALIDQLCARFGIRDHGGMQQSASLHIENTDFTLFHGGVLVPDSVVMYCDFGELPVPSREQILLRLLETNMYLFGQHSPAFTYSAQQNHIILMCRFPLAQADVESTAELLRFFADVARRWASDHFLFD